MPAVRHYGSQLLKDTAELPTTPPMLIDDLMYEESAWMLASDPGVGKSAIALQIAMAMTIGGKVFDAFQVQKAGPVYYLLLEGSYRRFIERLRNLSTVIPYDPDNLCVDVVEALNLTDQKHVDGLISRIESWKRPLAINFDSMYMALPGGLSRDDTAGLFAQASTQLMHHFKCCNIFLHHLHRQRYGIGGEQVKEGDRFYGSQFIKAHVNVSYQLTQEDDEYRLNPVMELKKDNEDCVRRYLSLQYHPESMACTLIQDESFTNRNNTILDRLLAYIHHCKNMGIFPDFKGVQSAVQCSTRQLRYAKGTPQVMSVVSFVKGKKGKEIWVPK